MLRVVSSTLYLPGQDAPAEKRTQNGRSRSLQNLRKCFCWFCRRYNQKLCMSD